MALQAEHIIGFPNSRRMTPTDYERERAQIRETYGDNSREAAAKSDQALAKLFYRSGWTQEELAKKEGKSRKWVDQHIRFGRFLQFGTDVPNSESLPKNVTEGYFRTFWSKTDKTESNERIRFRTVLALMNEDAGFHKSPLAARKLGDAIRKNFGDGSWHGLGAIAKRVGADEEDVKAHLDYWRAGNGAAKAERKQVGKSYSYRIFPKERAVSSVELREKLDPIIKAMFAASKKDIATISLSEMALLAQQLQRQLDEWVQ